MTGNLWFDSRDETTDFDNGMVLWTIMLLSLSCIKLNYWETLKLVEQIEF